MHLFHAFISHAHNNKTPKQKNHKSRSYLFTTATTACCSQAMALTTLLLLGLHLLILDVLCDQLDHVLEHLLVQELLDTRDKPHAKTHKQRTEDYDTGRDGCHGSHGILPAKHEQFAHTILQGARDDVKDVSEEVQELINSERVRRVHLCESYQNTVDSFI